MLRDREAFTDGDTTYIILETYTKLLPLSMQNSVITPPTDRSTKTIKMASNRKGCAVVYCSNTYYNVKEKKKLSFFRFPKDPER